MPVAICKGFCKATILPERGANCISLRHDGYGAVILREPAAQDQWDNPYLYGMPILFPVNRISGGSFTFEGREYRFPINEPATGCHLHGTLHRAEFSVLEQQEDRLLCAFRADADNPYLQFAHAFEIQMEYRMLENGMVHTTQIFNRSDTNMPVMLGFHTTFRAAFLSGSRPGDIRVQTRIAKEYERNMENYLPTGRQPEFDRVSTQLAAGEFDPFGTPISRHYRAGGTGCMVLYDAGRNVSVLYENDEKMPFRLIYNGGADEYICLEPQTCLANCPNAPVSAQEGGFAWIGPGQSIRYISKITIEQGDHRWK